MSTTPTLKLINKSKNHYSLIQDYKFDYLISERLLSQYLTIISSSFYHRILIHLFNDASWGIIRPQDVFKIARDMRNSFKK